MIYGRGLTSPAACSHMHAVFSIITPDGSRAAPPRGGVVVHTAHNGIGSAVRLEMILRGAEGAAGPRTKISVLTSDLVTSQNGTIRRAALSLILVEESLHRGSGNVVCQGCVRLSSFGQSKHCFARIRATNQRNCVECLNGDVGWFPQSITSILGETKELGTILRVYCHAESRPI